MRRLLAATLGLGLLAPIGRAETRAFAGYERVDVLSSGDREAAGLNGFAGAVDRDVAGRLGVKVEAGRAWRDTGGVRDARTSVLAGPVFRVVRGRGLDVFVEGLAGVIRASESFGILGANVSRGESRFGGLVGAGADIRASERFLVRIEGGYLVSRVKEGGTEKAVRASAGIVYRFGAR